MSGADNIHVHVRPATLADYQSVMAISEDIFSGFDYLGCWYRPLLQTKKSNFFVAELDEKVVGFKNHLITDDGKTAVSQAVRVHPSYRGRGIRTVLDREGKKILQRRLPELQRERLGIFLSDAHFKKLMDEPKNHESNLMIMNNAFHMSFWSYFTSAIPSVRKYLPDSQHTRVLTLAEANALLSKKYINRLFDKGMVMGYIFEPHDLTKENWRHICANHRLTASFSKSTGDLVALSLSAACQVSHGARYDIHFFGVDTNLLMSHVAMHICQLPECSDATKRLGFVVHYPPHMKRGMVSKWMTELVGPSLSPLVPPYDRSYVAETLFP